MKTFIPKIDPNNRNWYVVDLQDVILGRAAVQVADILRGKNKPIFTPHLDTGDHVVVVNAAGVKVTGNKRLQKKYHRYTGYPGGLRTRNFSEQMQKHPQDVFVKAVRGMLPKNRLGRKMIKKLHVYSGPEHPHRAQKPERLDI
ncbi:50S ribosomal protein L13 [bacterium]|nr:50S ribosomal protein L13 [bacterium]MCB2202132.1 50S ribosomal protein L13 [bacterium]